MEITVVVGRLGESICRRGRVSKTHVILDFWSARSICAYMRGLFPRAALGEATCVNRQSCVFVGWRQSSVLIVFVNRGQITTKLFYLGEKNQSLDSSLMDARL